MSMQSQLPKLFDDSPLQQGLRWILEEGRTRIRAGEPLRDEEIKSVFTRLTRALAESHPVKARPNVTVEGSLGKGRWTAVPWIALFNKVETTTARQGVYCVFLFCQDMSGVYLTLSQGVTLPAERWGRNQGREWVRRNARKLATKYGNDLKQRFSLEGGMNLQATSGLAADYEAATIANKLYPASRIPADAEILADLERLLSVYDDYVSTRGEGAGSIASEGDLAAVTVAFSTAIAASHIHFGSRHEELVRSFIAGLATKRFVILTGLSGSGKTQIAKRFGEWLGEGRRMVVPVRPDWTGPDALFGYEDALRPAADRGRKPWYVPPVLEFMLKAAGDTDHPYLLVLDEMNLAHVERYFADFLSGIESDEPCLPNLVQETTGEWLVPKGAKSNQMLPRNLFVVGTVNVDETTYMFSPKVLDRANTYEFRVATDDLQDSLQKPTDVAPGPDELVCGFLAVAQDDAWQEAHAAPNRQEFANHLRHLHELLSAGDFEFGHRVFYEANRYAAMLASAGNEKLEDALDQQVYQKVLPRLHGSRRRLEPTLRALGRFCWDLTADTSNESGKAFDPEAYDPGKAKLPLSAAKVRRMFRSLQANQFTSFTE